MQSRHGGDGELVGSLRIGLREKPDTAEQMALDFVGRGRIVSFSLQLAVETLREDCCEAAERKAAQIVRAISHAVVEDVVAVGATDDA